MSKCRITQTQNFREIPSFISALLKWTKLSHIYPSVLIKTTEGWQPRKTAASEPKSCIFNLIYSIGNLFKNVMTQIIREMLHIRSGSPSTLNYDQEWLTFVAGFCAESSRPQCASDNKYLWMATLKSLADSERCLFVSTHGSRDVQFKMMQLSPEFSLERGTLLDNPIALCLKHTETVGVT